MAETTKKTLPPVPTTIKVLSYTVEIVLDKAKLMIALAAKGIEPGCMGLCDVMAGKIYVDDTMSDDSIDDTIAHEIEHFIMAVTGAGTEFGGEDAEEKHIMMTSSVRWDTYRRNPELSKRLYRTDG